MVYCFYNCLDCNKSYKKEFGKDSAKVFDSLYKFCDGNINEYCLRLRKRVYPHKYMDT